jgi:hypothetical protein
VSVEGGRRVGLVVLVLLFGAALVLSDPTLDLGSVRVGGVSVLWWYAFVVGPTLVVLATVALLLRGRV